MKLFLTIALRNTNIFPNDETKILKLPTFSNNNNNHNKKNNKCLFNKLLRLLLKLVKEACVCNSSNSHFNRLIIHLLQLMFTCPQQSPFLDSVAGTRPSNLLIMNFTANDSLDAHEIL